MDSESSQVKGLTKHRHCLEIRKSVACLSTPKRTSMINFKFSCTTKPDYSAVTQLFCGQTRTNYSEYGSGVRVQRCCFDEKPLETSRHRWRNAVEASKLLWCTKRPCDVEGWLCSASEHSTLMLADTPQ